MRTTETLLANSKSDGDGIIAEHRWPCGPIAHLATALSSEPGIRPRVRASSVCVREENYKEHINGIFTPRDVRTPLGRELGG